MGKQKESETMVRVNMYLDRKAWKEFKKYYGQLTLHTSAHATLLSENGF